jgi:uncharacterized membrane protein HdeD (DUF308 family)
VHAGCVGEHGEAVRLLRPEVLVFVEILERLAKLDERVPVGTRRLQLLGGRRSQVLQLDPALIRVRRDRRGWQVDRNAEAVARVEQTLDFRVSRDVRVQRRADKVSPLDWSVQREEHSSSRGVGGIMMRAEADSDLRDVAKAWWALLLAGLLCVAAGVIVLVEPSISLQTLAVVTGIFLLVDGILEIVASIASPGENRGLLAVLGVISAIAGVILIRHPISGVVAVALILGLWLITIGIIRLIRTFSAVGRRIWSFLLAGVELIAGIVIVSSPHIGVATLALLVGISFIVRGIALCQIGWVLHAVKHDTPKQAAVAH